MPAVTRAATRRAALAEDNEQGESHRDESQGHRDEPQGQEVKLRDSHRVEVPQGRAARGPGAGTGSEPEECCYVQGGC